MKYKVYIPILIAVICWALSFVWVKQAYESFSPISLVIARLIGASIVMGIIGFAFNKIQPIKAHHFKMFALLAFFEPFLYFMGESFGLEIVSSSIGAVFISTIPLFTPFISAVMTKEKVSAGNIIGTLISLSGICVMVFESGGGINAPINGVLLMVLAVFAAVFYPIFISKLQPHYNGFSIILYQNLLGIFYFIPVFFIFDGMQFFQRSFTSNSLYALTMLTIFASVIAFLAFTRSVRSIGIIRTNVFINLIPVFTAIGAYFILGDPITLKIALGIGIVVVGLFVSQRSKSK